jgi:uncharacterized RDD family membrane protein YckC
VRFRAQADTDELVIEADLGERMLARGIDIGIWVGVAGLTVLFGVDRNDPTAGVILLGSMVAYEAMMVWAYAATIGKLVVGLRVFRYPGGEQLSLGRAFWRVLITYLGWFLPFGEGIMAASIYRDESGWGRGWHDRRVGTVVVKSFSARSVF